MKQRVSSLLLAPQSNRNLPFSYRIQSQNLTLHFWS